MVPEDRSKFSVSEGVVIDDNGEGRGTAQTVKTWNLSHGKIREQRIGRRGFGGEAPRSSRATGKIKSRAGWASFEVPDSIGEI